MNYKKIEAVLNKFVPDPKIPLVHKNPFTLLIAVMLSAQTTDASVNKVTPELFRLGPTPEKMAQLTVPQILKIIRTIGLAPTKAKNVLAISKALLENFNGKVPDTFEELETLPGVGHKTASVIMAHVFHKPSFVVDTHVLRSAKRWGISKSDNVKKVEEDCKKFFPEKDWNRVSLQMILFARVYCPAKKHDAAACPMCSKV